MPDTAKQITRNAGIVVMQNARKTVGLGEIRLLCKNVFSNALGVEHGCRESLIHRVVFHSGLFAENVSVLNKSRQFLDSFCHKIDLLSSTFSVGKQRITNVKGKVNVEMCIFILFGTNKWKDT